MCRVSSTAEVMHCGLEEDAPELSNNKRTEGIRRAGMLFR